MRDISPPVENTGWQGRIEKSLAESLSAMQLNNIEQNEKQSRALTEAGFQTWGHVMKGTGHGISPDGLSVALSFLTQLWGCTFLRRFL